ncbi:MBL fold metallo-hydrolase [Rheinheimera sp.]|uniref:MBL fold metallo-hydrolase n=1 Tax=Rheinheimera sp. TaxID=1869214 RepID=UPI00307F8636
MPLDASLTFYGAAEQVTGSCYLLRIGARRVLLDCGMSQGADQIREWHKFSFPFRPKDIDAVILSHAHIDHSGLLPLLVARGFRGKICCTEGTALLLGVLLKDSVQLYLKDLEWQNRQRARQGKSLLDPVMAVRDVVQVLEQTQPVGYRQKHSVTEDIELEFLDAGHILGSAIVQLQLKNGKASRRLVFSGDLGNPATVLMPDPSKVAMADIVLMESTYGDRNHQPLNRTLDEFAEALDNAYAAGGNVFIPAFALGRSQEILYYLGLLYQQKRLKQKMVVLDSPMAIEITKIYSRLMDEFDPKDTRLLERYGARDLQSFLPVLRLSATAEESAALNRVSSGAIVIAGSGMCNGGRIVHHLKHNLWKAANHIIFVGFQAQGTLGRQLVDGEKRVRLFGQQIAVKAQIHTIGGFSAHAGQSQLLSWASAIGGQPQFYLVHGEPKAQQALQQRMLEQGLQCQIAQKGQSIPL